MTKEEYKEIMKTENIIKVIDEVENEKYLQPIDISKFPRTRIITAPLPSKDWIKKRFKDSK